LSLRKVCFPCWLVPGSFTKTGAKEEWNRNRRVAKNFYALAVFWSREGRLSVLIHPNRLQAAGDAAHRRNTASPMRVIREDVIPGLDRRVAREPGTWRGFPAAACQQLSSTRQLWDELGAFLFPDVGDAVYFDLHLRDRELDCHRGAGGLVSTEEFGVNLIHRLEVAAVG